jgi:hypothetical protein
MLNDLVSHTADRLLDGVTIHGNHGHFVRFVGCIFHQTFAASLCRI